MKCPSCKYEQRTFTEMQDEVIRFKSGKRKGEIKEVNRVRKIYFEEDPDFIRLFFKKDVDSLVYGEKDDYFQDEKDADLYACPMCGTVIVEDINEGFKQ